MSGSPDYLHPVGRDPHVAQLRELQERHDVTTRIAILRICAHEDRHSVHRLPGQLGLSVFASNRSVLASSVEDSCTGRSDHCLEQCLSVFVERLSDAAKFHELSLHGAELEAECFSADLETIGC
jgi:hypothetical protein